MNIFKNKLKLILASLTLAVVPLLVPVVVSAAPPNITEQVQQGTCLSVNGDCPADGDAETKVNNIITTVINVFSLVVGVVSVIMIIIGGLKYITSGGESNNVTSAKNTIMYALVGLVIVALAQVIVRFVLGRVLKEQGT